MIELPGYVHVIHVILPKLISGTGCAAADDRPLPHFLDVIIVTASLVYICKVGSHFDVRVTRVWIGLLHFRRFWQVGPTEENHFQLHI